MFTFVFLNPVNSNVTNGQCINFMMWYIKVKIVFLNRMRAKSEPGFIKPPYTSVSGVPAMVFTMTSHFLLVWDTLQSVNAFGLSSRLHAIGL